MCVPPLVCPSLSLLSSLLLLDYALQVFLISLSDERYLRARSLRVALFAKKSVAQSCLPHAGQRAARGGGKVLLIPWLRSRTKCVTVTLYITQYTAYIRLRSRTKCVTVTKGLATLFLPHAGQRALRGEAEAITRGIPCYRFPTVSQRRGVESQRTRLSQIAVPHRHPQDEGGCSAARSLDTRELAPATPLTLPRAHPLRDKIRAYY